MEKLLFSRRQKRKAEEAREATEFAEWLKDVSAEFDDWTEPATAEPSPGGSSTHSTDPS
jgi:hypothetical protein